MNITFAEARRAAGIATTMLAPIALMPALMPREFRRVEEQPPATLCDVKPASTAPTLNDMSETPVVEVATVRHEVHALDPEPTQAAVVTTDEQDATVEEPDVETVAAVACAPIGLTREILSARAGVTHKDIQGERELELIRRYQGGDRNAGEILLRAHEKFIAYSARRHGGKRKHDLDQEDVLTHAQLGFLEGVAKFDPNDTRGAQLLTYAEYWIRSAVKRAIVATGTTVRVPEYTQDKRGRGGKYAESARLALSPIRLDAPVGDDDDDRTMLDMVASGDNPEAEIADREWEEKMARNAQQILAVMPEKMVDILRRRAEGETLEAIGQRLGGLSRERVRQIEADAKKAARRIAKRMGIWEDSSSRAVAVHAGIKMSSAAALPVVPETATFERGCRQCGELGHHTATCERWAGRRFGRLVVLRGADASQTTGGHVLVRCDCGNEKVVRSAHLNFGKIESCGCLRAEWLAKARAPRELRQKKTAAA